MSDDNTFIGVDPGLEGALALLNRHGLLALADMPTVGDGKDRWVSPKLLTDLLDGWERECGAPRLVVVERVRAMPKQGVSSTFKFGHGYGVILGCVSRYPVLDPTPRVWKKEMGLTSDKELSRAMALRQWPEWSDHFKRKKDADRAEAALLGAYGIKQQGHQ